MAVTVLETEIPGVRVLKPDRFGDGRGFFMELYHRDRYAELGLDQAFVQDNYSRSCKGTLRGLHHQFKHPQDKLVFVITGTIRDIVVDARLGSPAYGKWIAVEISAEEGNQIFVPKGCLHGFAVLSETADVMYKCTDVYCPEGEQGVLWSDPDIGVNWGVEEPMLSDKDKVNPLLKDVPKEHLLEWTS